MEVWGLGEVTDRSSRRALAGVMVCSSSRFAIKRLSRGADDGMGRTRVGEFESSCSVMPSLSEEGSVSVPGAVLARLADGCGNMGVERG